MYCALCFVCCTDEDASRVQDKKRTSTNTSTSTSQKGNNRMSIDDDFMDNDDGPLSISASTSASFHKRNRLDSKKRNERDGELNRSQNRKSNESQNSRNTFSFSSDDEDGNDNENRNDSNEKNISRKKSRIEVQPIREKMKLRFSEDQLTSFCSLTQCFLLLKKENIKLAVITDLLKKKEVITKNQSSRFSLSSFESGKKKEKEQFVGLFYTILFI